jgi:hypothetical protein
MRPRIRLTQHLRPTPATAETSVSQIGRSIFVVNDVDGKFGDAPGKAHRGQ